MTFYCPSCWNHFITDVPRCPFCGFDIKAFSVTGGYVDKLIAALNHPEPTTPIRAAWILGHRREAVAAGPLSELARQSQDVFVISAAVRALIAIGTSEALASVEKLVEQVPAVVQRLIEESMRDKFRSRA